MQKASVQALLGVFGGICLFGASASAQVNVEPLRERLKSSGYTAQVQASTTAYQGNANGINLSAASFLGLASAEELAYLMASGDYIQSGGTTSVAKLFAHLRYNHVLTSSIVAEAFAQWEQDRFRRLTGRELFGVGPRFQLAQDELLVAYVGVAYMLELTQRRAEAELTGHNRVNHRLSSYASLKYQPHPRISLNEIVYFQPRFDLPRDYFLVSTFGASFEVTQRLASGLDLTVRHENMPPADLRKTDLQLVSSLKLTW